MIYVRCEKHIPLDARQKDKVEIVNSTRCVVCRFECEKKCAQQQSLAYIKGVLK